MAKATYKSDIQVGELYIDKRTGFEGTAVAICFYEFACERVTLERTSKHDQRIEESTFDAPRLTSVKTGKLATTPRTGGDRPGVAQARTPERR